MLSEVQLATVRAALQFWREEICPFIEDGEHGEDGEAGGNTAKAYFDVPVERQLSSRQVLALQRLFREPSLRYIPYDAETERIAAAVLVTDLRTARRAAANGLAVGTVLLG